MADLITIAEAKAHLRIDGTGDDAWLAIFIPVVSEAVALWLKRPSRLYEPMLDADGLPILDSAGDPIPMEDSDGDPTVRAVVKAAAMVELATMYRWREGEGENVVPSDAGYGYSLSKGATALLAPLRKSTIA